MTPFLQFRLWARNGPVAERVGVAGVFLVLVGRICWALVPVGSQSPATNVGTIGSGGAPATSGGVAGGAGATSGSVAAGGSVSPVSTVSGAAGGGGAVAGVGGGTGSAATVRTPNGSGGSVTPVSGGPAPAGGCGTLTSTDQGVTSTEVHIDIDVANLAGQAGNQLVGLPPAQEEEAMFQAAINAVNKAGGIRCRKLVAKYYEVDALDPSSLQAACLQIVADHPFALIDQGLGSPSGSTTPRDCPPSYKVPLFGALNVSQAELNQYGPYLIGARASIQGITNDYVYALNRLGWLAHAKKVGLLEQDCIPGLNSLVLSDLAKVGVPSSKVSTFDFGCPDQIPSPSQVEQAVLQFKTAGVTNVMDDGGYENYFSKDAQSQDYHPAYSVGDGEGEVALWDNPQFGPDATNFSGGIAITDSQYGAENTPGTAFNAETAACDKAMAAEGLPSAEKSPDAESGTSCVLVDLLAIAADNAPSLVRADLAAGIQRAGTVQFAFPDGPGNFAQSGGLHGGGFWRVDTWVTSCSCFRVSTPTYTPSFS